MVKYGILALAWAASSSLALSHKPAVGTLCTFGWAVSIPLMQLGMSLLDSILLVGIDRVRRNATNGGQNIFHVVSRLCLFSAGLVAIASISTIPFSSDITWSLTLRWLDLASLLIDSSLASGVLIGTLFLLSDLHTTSIAAVISGSTFYGAVVGSLLLRLSWSYNSAFLVYAAVACCHGLHSCAIEAQQAARAGIARLLTRLFRLSSIALALFVALQCIAMSASKKLPSMADAVEQLVSASKGQAAQWVSQASISKSLLDATLEYRRRYSIPPPPNFDKWYEFARERNVTVVDDFNQIHNDLSPYWAIEPVDLRARTLHLLEYARVEMGGIRIKNGTIEQAANIPGTHRWMTNAIEDMIRPFVQWLPDMDVAINLGDESRVAAAFEKMEALHSLARKNRDQIASKAQSTESQGDVDWSDGLWPPMLPQPTTFSQKVFMSPNFTTDIRRQIYYDRIAPTCPPKSAARRHRWWDWGVACIQCTAPHSVLTESGFVVSNVSLATDLCHQPDMSGLSGFIMSSANSITTQDLFPVFSQGRASGYSDILFPSPWNYIGKSKYDEAADTPWAGKTNGVFWRGASTDGFSADGKWMGFLRTRFVHEAYQQARKRIAARRNGKTLPLASIDVINVTFSGDSVISCHWPDCGLQQAALESMVSEEALYEPRRKRSVDDFSPRHDRRDLPEVTPFEDHWGYRHLMDMDGAGFSGRFVSFLESHSLIYRVCGFRTWFDERLQPWYHYVPADGRLGEGFWAMVDYFGSTVKSISGKSGEDHGAAIAEQGRDWAHKVLRREDMEVYMFRLLLEWGRLVDDRRDELMFHIDDG